MYLASVGKPLVLLFQELAEVRADRGVHQYRLVEVGVTLGRCLEGGNEPHRRVFEQALQEKTWEAKKA